MFAEKGTTRCFLSRNGSFSECCASCAAIQVLAGGQSKRLLQDKLLYMFCTLALGTVCSLRSGERTAHLWQLYPVCFDTSYAVSFNNISVMPTPSHTKHHTHIHIPLFFMVYAINLKCTNYVPSLIIFLSVLAEKLLKNKLIPNILPQANCVATSFCDSRISFLAA